MSERPKNADEQARDSFEPAAALLPAMSEAALASIAISLRRMADASLMFAGYSMTERSALIRIAKMLERIEEKWKD
jgi:glutamine synthetase